MHPTELTSMLAALARTLVGSSSAEVLEHLVEAGRRAVPGSVVEVTVFDGPSGPTSVAGGPGCTDRARRTTDLPAGDRATRSTFPLGSEGRALGALTFHHDDPLGPEAEHAALLLADVGSSYVANAHRWAASRAEADALHHLALHDPLTGLANRLLLEERIQGAAERSRRTHRSVAVVFVDLDRFKTVNDAHGHRIGDQLLIAVARRLAELARPGDTVARISGDEFVLLCEGLPEPAPVEGLVQRIRDAFATPFLLPSDLVVSIAAAVGAASADDPAQITELLVAAADRDMYAMKRRSARRRAGTDAPPPLAMSQTDLDVARTRNRIEHQRILLGRILAGHREAQGLAVADAAALAEVPAAEWLLVEDGGDTGHPDVVARMAGAVGTDGIHVRLEADASVLPTTGDVLDASDLLVAVDHGLRSLVHPDADAGDRRLDVLSEALHGATLCLGQLRELHRLDALARRVNLGEAAPGESVQRLRLVTDAAPARQAVDVDLTDPSAGVGPLDPGDDTGGRRAAQLRTGAPPDR